MEHERLIAEGKASAPRVLDLESAKQELDFLLEQSVREHLEIIRLAKTKKAAALGAYFRDVHWNYQAHLPYVDEVFAKSPFAPAEDPNPFHRLRRTRDSSVLATKRARRKRQVAVAKS